MEGERNETWPDSLLPSPLQPGATAQPGISGWTFASHQSPLSDFSKAVDLSAEFPFSALKHLPEEAALWATTPLEQFSYQDAAATGNRGVDRVVAKTTEREAESPVADLQETYAAALRRDADALLSAFRQDLSRSMSLSDSALRPFSDGQRTVNGVQGGTRATPPVAFMGIAAADGIGQGATLPVLGFPVRSEVAANRSQDSVGQREHTFWFAGVGSAASDSHRHTREVDSSAESRAKGPQRRLKWDEESTSGGQPRNRSGGSGADLLACPSSQSHRQANSRAALHREGSVSSAKRTPLLIPRRLTLMTPPAHTSALMLVNVGPERAFTSDTGEGSSSAPQFDAHAGPGVPHDSSIWATKQQRQQHQPDATPLGQFQQTHDPETDFRSTGLEFTTLLANTSPLTLSTLYSLQPPSESRGFFAPSPMVCDGIPVYEHEWAGFTRSDDHSGMGTSQQHSVTPLSANAPLQSSDWGGREQAVTPHTVQDGPLLPEASVTPEWLPVKGRRPSPSAATQCMLQTPESEASFSHGSFGVTSGQVEVPRSAASGSPSWPTVVEEGDEGDRDVPSNVMGSVEPEDGKEPESPVPPDYPWPTGSPGGVFGSPDSSAASGGQSTLQHTDLSNLLDTSSSASVAGIDPGPDELQLQSLVNPCGTGELDGQDVMGMTETSRTQTSSGCGLMEEEPGEYYDLLRRKEDTCYWAGDSGVERQPSSMEQPGLRESPMRNSCTWSLGAHTDEDKAENGPTEPGVQGMAGNAGTQVDHRSLSGSVAASTAQGAGARSGDEQCDSELSGTPCSAAYRPRLTSPDRDRCLTWQQAQVQSWRHAAYGVSNAGTYSSVIDASEGNVAEEDRGVCCIGSEASRPGDCLHPHVSNAAASETAATGSPEDSRGILGNLPPYEVSWASETDIPADLSRAWGSSASRRETRDTDLTSASGASPSMAAADALVAAAVDPAAESTAALPAADATLTSARSSQGKAPEGMHVQDVRPPDDAHVDPTLQTSVRVSPEKEVASFSFGRHSGTPAIKAGANSFQTCRRSPRASTRTTPAASGAGSVWFAAEGKARRYDPSGYRSTDSSTEFGRTDMDTGSGRQRDATPRVDSEAKTFRPWQIQENPAFEEDLDVVGASAELGYGGSQGQLSPLAHQSSFTAGMFGNGGMDSAREDSHGAPTSSNNMDHIGANSSRWTPITIATAAVSDPHLLSTSGHLTKERAVRLGAGQDVSASSSDSDSPRTSAFNRVLASSGLGASARSEVRSLPGRKGMLRSGLKADADPDTADVDVGDRRDTHTNRTMGSQSTSSAGMPAIVAICRGTISSVKNPEDRSLILELEHAHTLLVHTLAAAGEPPMLTPPPPSPAPAPGPYGGATMLTTRTQAHGAKEEEATLTPGASSGSGESQGDSEGLNFSTCSSLSHGISNPLVAQVAMAAMGKALARVAKLSRENQGLQRVNEQLRSELSHSNSKHMELQTRSKLLHAMLAESGREAERKAQAQQRRLLRMDTHLNFSLHRIRELERVNTQLSLESRQVERQLQQAQNQVAEANHAAGKFRGQVALLERQLATVHSAGEAELQLAEALSEATKNNTALLHQVTSLEQRLEDAHASGVTQKRTVEALREQVEGLEAQQASGSAAANFDRDPAAEATVEELRRQVEMLGDQLRAVREGAEGEHCRRVDTETWARQVEQLRSACTAADARVQELEEELRLAQVPAAELRRLEAELQTAREELGRLQLVKDAAAQHERQLQAELQAARVAMVELRAERAAARAEALRMEDDAQKASLAAQEACSEAELAAADYARAAVEAREAEQCHAVALAEAERAAAELRQQLDVATREAQRLASQATVAEQRAAAAEEREREILAQLQSKGAEEERTRAELEEAQQTLEEVKAAQESTAETAATVAELEMALAAESARVIEEAQLREQAEMTHRMELHQLYSQLQVTQDNQQRADAELRDLQATHKDTWDELTRLSLQLAAARSELESLHQERDQLRSEHAQLVAQAQEKANELANALQQASTLCDCVAALDVDKQQMWADLSVAEAKVLEVLGRLAEAESTHESLFLEMEGLRRELRQTHDAAGITQSRLEAAEADKSALAHRVQQLRQELKQHAVIAQKAFEADMALKEIQGRLDHLTGDLAATHASLRKREEELAAAKEELEAVTAAHSSALAEAQARSTEARSHADFAEAAFADAEARAEAAATAFTDAEARSEAAIKACAEAEARAKAAAEACAEANARAAAVAQARVEAEAALEVERIKAADLEAEMQVATRKMVELQKTVEVQAAAAATASAIAVAVEEEHQRRLLRSAAEVVSSCAQGSSTSEASPSSGLHEEPVAATTSTARSSACKSACGAVELEPTDSSLKLAGQVVVAQAELADLQTRHADAEEMIGNLRQELSDQQSIRVELEVQLQKREDELASAQRGREDVFLQLQLLQLRDAQRQREAAATAASVQAGLQQHVIGGSSVGGSRFNTQVQPPFASAVYSSAGWSPSSSLRVERCSMVMPLSPTRSWLRDSNATFDECRLPPRPNLISGGIPRSSGPYDAVPEGHGGYGAMAVGEFTASATPVSMWVEPGSAGGECAIGTLASALEALGSDASPPMALVPASYGRYRDQYTTGAVAPSGVAATAAPHLRNSQACSPDASISLRVRPPGYGHGGCVSVAVADASPHICGFEPVGAAQHGPQQQQQQMSMDGLRASYGSVACGGAGGGEGLQLGTGGGSSGGVQLTVQLLELRYAMQKVEQAAGELAAVLLAVAGRSAAYNMNLYSTPMKTSSAGSAVGGCASRIATGSRRPLTARLGDPAAEATIQERVWLADSLANLTSRAGSVAEQLDSCLDAALAARGTVVSTASAMEQHAVGSKPDGGQRLLSSLAIRVLEGELDDLRRDLEEQQLKTEKVLEMQRVQHLKECTALAADLRQCREQKLWLQEQLAALEQARCMSREHDQEALLQAESQHYFVQQLEQRCREQEVVMAQLQRKLDEAAAAGAAGQGEREHTHMGATRAGAGPSALRSHGHGHGGTSGVGYHYVSVGADRQLDGAAGPGMSDCPSRYSENRVSSYSIGDTCPSTEGEGANSAGSCGSCHVAGGGAYSSGTVGRFAAQGRREQHPRSNAVTGGRSTQSTVSAALTLATTPNSAETRALHVDIFHADHRYHHDQDRGGFPTNTAASPREGMGPAEEDSSRRVGGAAPAGGCTEASEDEARLWTEMLQLLKAGDAGGTSHSRGTSTASGRHRAEGAAPAPQLLALPAAGEAEGPIGMQLAKAPQSARSTDTHLVAATAAESTQGRAEMLARAISHISLLSAQNRKLAKLLKGVAAGRAAAAPAPGIDGLVSRYETLQKENDELREKYNAAQLAQTRSEQAMRKLGHENRQLHSQVLELIGAQTVAIQARSATSVSISSIYAVD